MSRFEELLQKILNGEKIENWECQSRLEEHLIACINKTGLDGLNTPITRAEELLQLLAIQMQDDIDITDLSQLGYVKPSGDLSINENGTYDAVDFASVTVNVSSTPVAVATASDMDALLTADNVGKIYQYTGVTNETYTNGELYQVVEEV